MDPVAGVDADRWLEVDLYWFDREDLAVSVAQFWERIEPLLHHVLGWRGIIVNAGWLADHILAWLGDPAAIIPIPKGMRKDKFFPDNAPLLGTVDERKIAWHARFDDRGTREAGSYEPWTYADLGRLADLLREIGLRQHQIDDVKVGIFVVGWDSIYACEPSKWSERHPEAFFKGPWVDRLFNVVAELSEDPVPTAAFPDGIPAGTPIARYFGQQWGHLAKTLHLDAIVLRDSMIGQGIYERLGPFGTTASPDPAEVARWSQATAALVRETKLGAPQALVIGYSNAASGVADWRVNCVDLESIAHEGHLDAWIDQTWAGAWNEVGQREDIFWNLPLLGWTNQLGFVLLRAAALAETSVRHYVLTETFDAWESWDIIHTAPERLRWGIWAYLHAFVKMPTGLKAPRGNYVSWLNQGKRLLTEQDVHFLATTLDEATADTRATTEVFGPTAVYSRSAMAWQSAHAPEADIKEWIDEQIGFLSKFSVPIMSVTRSEYLGRVDSDYLIIQTPVHLPEEQLRSILDRIEQDRPTMIVGSPGGGFDQRIAQAVGLSADGDRTGGSRSTATRGPAADADIPETFEIVHRWTANRAEPDVDVLYLVDDSPVLVRRGQVSAWDPADVHHRVIAYTGGWDFGRHNGDRSIVEIMGSPYPFLLTAREITRALRAAGAISARSLDSRSPVSIGAWRSNGLTRVLVADLEEGFRESTHFEDQVLIDVPDEGCTITVPLTYGRSALFTVTARSAIDQWPSIPIGVSPVPSN